MPRLVMTPPSNTYGFGVLLAQAEPTTWPEGLTSQAAEYGPPNVGIPMRLYTDPPSAGFVAAHRARTRAAERRGTIVGAPCARSSLTVGERASYQSSPTTQGCAAGGTSYVRHVPVTKRACAPGPLPGCTPRAACA